MVRRRPVVLIDICKVSNCAILPSELAIIRKQNPVLLFMVQVGVFFGINGVLDGDYGLTGGEKKANNRIIALAGGFAYNMFQF